MSKKIPSQDSNSNFEWDVEECKRAYWESAKAYDNLLHELLDNEQSIPIGVEEGPSGVEGLPTLSIRSPLVDKRSDESESGMENASLEVEVHESRDELS